MAKRQPRTKTAPPEPNGTVQLVCIAAFEGPEGRIARGDHFDVSADTEEKAQARADVLVSTLHVARRLPGEAA